MEIESSDEEEAADNTGSVMNPCEQHLQSGLQNATNRYFRSLFINRVLCVYYSTLCFRFLLFVKSFCVVYTLTESNVGD